MATMAKEPAAGSHDAVFKMALGDQGASTAFFRERLPQQDIALLAPDPPELVPGSFVDDRLRQHHSDLLYRRRLVDGGHA